MAANGENNAVNRPQDAPHHEFVERLRLTGRLLLKKIDCLENGRDGDKTLEWLAEQLDKMDPDNSDHLFEINSAVAYAKGYLNGKRDPPRTFHCYCYQIQGPGKTNYNRIAPDRLTATTSSDDRSSSSDAREVGSRETRVVGSREALQENVVATSSGSSSTTVDEQQSQAKEPNAEGLETAYEATAEQQPAVAWESCPLEKEIDEPDYTLAVEPDHQSREDGGPDVFSVCFGSLIRPRREDGEPHEEKPFRGPPGVMQPVSEEMIASEEYTVMVGSVADAYYPLGCSWTICSIL